VALFVALAGAGVAASLTLVRAPKPVMLVSGNMPADGKLIGGLSHGTEKSTGVYTLTIRGDTFAPNGANAALRSVVTPVVPANAVGIGPPMCSVAAENVASNGGATAEVDCFSYDPAAGWQPASTAFDFQMVGPSR
jgi:hypothetical protein